MITIWKYELEFNGMTKLDMPKGATILTVQQDQKTNKPCLWVMVDTEEENETRYIELFGTGNEIKYDMGIDRKYIETYQYQRGEFVGHVFERIN